jgi:predicted DNA-binding transcriptional regulator YafY
VDGEAGLGYLLRPGFFLPPLMFSEDELEALVLGARFVERQGDSVLKAAAVNALAKIASVAPRDLRDTIGDSGLYAGMTQRNETDRIHLPLLREAIRRERKLDLAYIDQDGRSTARTVWPIAIAFYEGKQILAAWCELRQAFRHFRTDRIAGITATETRYPTRRPALVKAWRAEISISE